MAPSANMLEHDVTEVIPETAIQSVAQTMTEDQATGTKDHSDDPDAQVEHAVVDKHPYKGRHWNETKMPNILVNILKQLKPGMDLTRVTLPAFILEPRSLLEKWGDFLSYPQDVFCAAREPDSERRFMFVLSWYMSGFSLLPNGVRKPYNPVLGEQHRFYVDHNKHPFPSTHSRDPTVDMTPLTSVTHNPTVYVAEQVSHHPPISAFHISNRKAGFTVKGWIYTRSKFTGNSAGAILEGRARLKLLRFDETYETSFPTCFTRGVLVGHYMMEMSGAAECVCPKLALKASIDFKPKPLLKGKKGVVRGQIKRHGQTIYRIDGNHLTGAHATREADGHRVCIFDPELEHYTPRMVAPLARLAPNESHKRWAGVSQALDADPSDYNAATKAKTAVEDEERARRAQRVKDGEVWTPKLFVEGEWPFAGGDVTGVSKTDWTWKELDESPYEGEGDDKDGMLRQAAIVRGV